MSDTGEQGTNGDDRTRDEQQIVDMPASERDIEAKQDSSVDSSATAQDSSVDSRATAQDSSVDSSATAQESDVDESQVEVLPGTGGPDDVGDIEVDPSELNLSGDSIPGHPKPGSPEDRG